MLLVIYVVFSIFVGWLGRNKQIGFVGFVLLSLLISPVISLIILMMAKDRRPMEAS
jgi:hypothetical protein